MDINEILDCVFYKTDKETGERKVSCCKLIIVVFVILMIIGALTGGSSNNQNQTEEHSLNINVPNGFIKDDNAVGLQFDGPNDINIRVLQDSDNPNASSKYDKGFTKVNDTTSTWQHFTEMGNTVRFSYAIGEYVKINGEKYWVEVGSSIVDNNPESHFDLMHNCTEVMDYLNSHNDWEFVS